jgi:2-methylfumaryl-CoA isomerase
MCLHHRQTLITGLYLAVGILAAERVRQREGHGQYISIALSDVMLATVGNLGYLGEVQLNDVSREPIGNDVTGLALRMTGLYAFRA